MKNTDGLRTPRSIIIICLAVLAFASLPLLTRARAASTSVTIVNNSSREIRNVYTSHVDRNDWSGGLLGGATIAAGHSSDVSNLACDGQQIKVIAEDQDGCFLSTVINCGASATWTITNDSARDCD